MRNCIVLSSRERGSLSAHKSRSKLYLGSKAIFQLFVMEIYEHVGATDGGPDRRHGSREVIEVETNRCYARSAKSFEEQEDFKARTYVMIRRAKYTMIQREHRSASGVLGKSKKHS